MTTPARDSGAHADAGASDAATPGHTSVAAHFGGGDLAGLDTPGGAASPGESSPARHRSQEGRSANDAAALQHSGSRGRAAALGGSDAAAARAAPAAAAPDAAPAAAEPLSKPRLRVQGADIILEDAASPRATANGDRDVQQQPGEAAAAAAGGGGPVAQQPAAAAARQQQQQQQETEQQVQQRLLAQVMAQANQHQQHLAAMRGSQSHEHELQLRLASRTATGASNMAIASTRHPVPHGDDRWVGGWMHGCGVSTSHSCGAPAAWPVLAPAWRAVPPVPSPQHHLRPAPPRACSRLRGLHDAAGGGDAVGGGRAGDEAPVRLKYRSSLTEENVAYLNKLDQYASRPESGSAARSSGAPPAAAGAAAGAGPGARRRWLLRVPADVGGWAAGRRGRRCCGVLRLPAGPLWR